MNRTLTSAELLGAKASRRPLARLIRLGRKQPLGTLGILLVLGAALLAIFAPWLIRYPPEQIFGGFKLVGPSSRFWFGTDDLARDVFSRVVFGSRVSIFVGLVSVAIGTTLGAVIGVTSAYLGGKWDLIIQRIMDMVMAFPALILALAIMAALGQSLTNVIIALVIVVIPSSARILRSTALSIKEMQYVEAARAIGASSPRIIWRYIAINCGAPYIIIASASLGNAIIAEASLSFLGVGTPAEIPSWGSMLGGSAQLYVANAPWLGIFPGLALSLAVFGINLFGDALRDVLDPRLRGSR